MNNIKNIYYTLLFVKRIMGIVQKETVFMAQLFEVFMLICFGVSWPISVVKSIKSKSTGGKSLVFTVVIIVGYICGIISKVATAVATGSLPYVFWLYIFNIVMVGADLVIWIINKRREVHINHLNGNKKACKHNKALSEA